MKSKTYSTDKITEDTAPTVAVGNGVIDTAPVVTKEQQKKITMLSRFKKLKSFKQFLEENLLMESPAYMRVHPEVNAEIMNGIIHDYRDSHEHVGGSMYKFKTKGDHFVLFHKTDDGRYHSGSFFKMNNDHIVHQVTDKIQKDIRPHSIYKNIQYMLDNGHEIRSDSTQSIGGSILWSKMHDNVRYNTAAVIQNGIHHPVENFKDKEGIFDPSEIYSIKK